MMFLVGLCHVFENQALAGAAPASAATETAMLMRQRVTTDRLLLGARLRDVPRVLSRIQLRETGGRFAIARPARVSSPRRCDDRLPPRYQKKMVEMRSLI